MDAAKFCTPQLGGLYLTGNTNLLNIDGLSGASGPFTGGQDFISGNPMLQNLNGLAGITGCNTLTIRNCDALVDMTGLGGMTEVTNQLSINNNPGITSLNGLNPNLEIGNRLTVVANALLSDCAVEAVCNHLNMNGNNFITANPAGCANAADVINNCNADCADGITETLTTQEEVDAFATTYGNCRNFLGEIIIEEPQNRGESAAAITNLDALSNLRQIGVLRILNAPSLDNLSGLALLDSINGDLDIRNTAIVNLSNLSNLKKIGRRLDIAFNPVLESVTSFTEIDLIPNFLVIRFNPVLNDLSGFSNLVTVSDVLEFFGNPSLPDLTDFSSLRFAFDGLTIDNNDMLTSLAGLETLENINAGLRILNNDMLTDISTLNNLDQATIIATSNGAPGSAALIIRDNPLLSNCAIETVCTFLDGSGTAVDIQGNATNCASQAIVESNCNILPITLHTFSADLSGKSVRLSWQTASEENTEKYILERSSDNGQSFVSVGSVAALNRPDGAQYTFLDENLTGLNGTLYYRMIAKDFDGVQEVYGPVSVELTGEPETLRLVPNPASPHQSVRILGANAGAEVKLYSIDGRSVSTLLAVDGSDTNFFLPNLAAPGVYLLQSTSRKGERKTARVIIR